MFRFQRVRVTVCACGVALGAGWLFAGEGLAQLRPTLPPRPTVPPFFGATPPNFGGRGFGQQPGGQFGGGQFGGLGGGSGNMFGGQFGGGNQFGSGLNGGNQFGSGNGNQFPGGQGNQSGTLNANLVPGGFIFWSQIGLSQQLFGNQNPASGGFGNAFGGGFGNGVGGGFGNSFDTVGKLVMPQPAVPSTAQRRRFASARGAVPRASC